MPPTSPAKGRGFTLIELIVVIVILGVLAATALPKFIDMRSDASQATLSGLRGQVASAMQLAKIKCIMTSGCAGHGMYLIDGVWRRFLFGYPDAGDSVTNDIGSWLNVSSVTVVNASGKTRFQSQNARDPTLCYVEYAEATSFTAQPTVTDVSTGC